jgi:hypothetical protein
LFCKCAVSFERTRSSLLLPCNDHLALPWRPPGLFSEGKAISAPEQNI